MENNKIVAALPEASVVSGDSECVEAVKPISLSDMATWEPWMKEFVFRDCIAPTRAGVRAKFVAELDKRGISYVD